MLQILGTIIFGAIVGILARAVLPGRQAYGWIITILLGVAGALIGYWVWGALGAATPGASTGSGWPSAWPGQLAQLRLHRADPACRT